MCNVHVTALFCGPLLQLCRLHATKLKKNVVGAACVKHGNACISSIFSLFCGGRQRSQGLFGGRGCANLIASLTVKLFDVIALLQMNCLIIIIYYNIIWTLLNVVKVSLPFCWVWIVVLFGHPSHLESRPKYPSSPPPLEKKENNQQVYLKLKILLDTLIYNKFYTTTWEISAIWLA